MGLFTNILILYFCFTVAIYGFGVETTFTQLVENSEDFNATINNIVNAFTGINPLTGFVTIAIGALIASLVAGGGFALNTALIVLAASMLMRVFTFPVGLTNEGALPEEIRLMVLAFILILQLMFSWGLALVIAQRD